MVQAVSTESRRLEKSRDIGIAKRIYRSGYMRGKDSFRQIKGNYSDLVIKTHTGSTGKKRRTATGFLLFFGMTVKRTALFLLAIISRTTGYQ
jgi:hypothetical protein